MAIIYVGANAPKAGADTNYNTGTGSTLHTALAALSTGDTLWLEDGETYSAGNESPFSVPTGVHNVTVRPAGWSGLPLANKTTVESSDLAAMPRIRTNFASAAFRCLVASNGWTVQGIKFQSTFQDGNAPAGSGTYNVVEIGNYSATSLSELCDAWVLDRCAFLGPGGLYPCRNGMVLSAKAATIRGCWFDEIKATSGVESHAIVGWAGVGPYTIEDNFIRCAGLTMLFGGATRGIEGSIHDGVTIERNHFTRKWEWWHTEGATAMGVTAELADGWFQKNHIEFKNGVNILINGNLIERTWLSADAGQRGACVICTPTQEGNTTAGRVANVTITNNIARDVGEFVCLNGGNTTNVYGDIGDPGEHVVRNNLVYRRDRKFALYQDGVTYVNGRGLQCLIGQDAYITFENNAIWGDGEEDVNVGSEQDQDFQAGLILMESSAGYPASSDALKQDTLICRNNVIRGYAFGSGAGYGISALNNAFRTVTMTNNLAQDSIGQTFAAGDWKATTREAVEAEWSGDWRNGDMRFNANSDYAAGGSRDGTDGQDIGPNYAQIYAAVQSLWPFGWTPDSVAGTSGSGFLSSRFFKQLPDEHASVKGITLW